MTFVSQYSHVEVIITSSTSECNSIRRAFKEVIKLKEVTRVGSNPGVLLRRGNLGRHTREDHVKIQEKLAIYKPRKEGLRRILPFWHLDFGLLASKAMRK